MKRKTNKQKKKASSQIASNFNSPYYNFIASSDTLLFAFVGLNDTVTCITENKLRKFQS